MTGADLAALLGPVRAGNAFEETVERMLTVIKLGLVAPGDRFPPERKLAAQLGVSRLTLREAIRALQQAGFVESRRGRFGGTRWRTPAGSPTRSRSGWWWRPAPPRCSPGPAATGAGPCCWAGWRTSTTPPRATTGGWTRCSTWRSPS